MKNKKPGNKILITFLIIFIILVLSLPIFLFALIYPKASTIIRNNVDTLNNETDENSNQIPQEIRQENIFLVTNRIVNSKTKEFESKLVKYNISTKEYTLIDTQKGFESNEVFPTNYFVSKDGKSAYKTYSSVDFRKNGDAYNSVSKYNNATGKFETIYSDRNKWVLRDEFVSDSGEIYLTFGKGQPKDFSTNTSRLQTYELVDGSLKAINSGDFIFDKPETNIKSIVYSDKDILLATVIKPMGPAGGLNGYQLYVFNKKTNKTDFINVESLINSNFNFISFNKILNTVDIEGFNIAKSKTYLYSLSLNNETVSTLVEFNNVTGLIHTIYLDGSSYINADATLTNSEKTVLNYYSTTTDTTKEISLPFGNDRYFTTAQIVNNSIYFEFDSQKIIEGYDISTGKASTNLEIPKTIIDSDYWVSFARTIY